ncbi:MAG: sulfotransferase [Alphaproteobacteria bacterium]
MAPDSIKSIVCISFFGRSGSYLLSNLLDNHPEVLSVPPHALTDFFLDMEAKLNDAARGHGEMDIFKYLESNVGWLFQEADHTELLGPVAKEMAPLGAPAMLFGDHMRTALNSLSARDALSIGGIFKAIHVAYAAAIGRKLATSTPIIVWQKHVPMSPEQLAFFSRFIETPLLVVTVRRPEVTFSAHFEHHVYDRPGPPFHSLPVRIFRTMIDALRYAEVAPDRTFAVRFEDMHGRTEAVMRALATGPLAIDWHPSLLETTIDGRPFLFPKKGGFVTGTNPDVEKHQSAPWLSALDAVKLRHVLAADIAAWGYEGNGRFLESLLRFRPLRRLLFALPLRIELHGLLVDLKGLFGNGDDRPFRVKLKEAFALAKSAYVCHQMMVDLFRERIDGGPPAIRALRVE